MTVHSRIAMLTILLAAGCSAPSQVILPGKLGLAVEKGDELKLCPNDGVDDTTPDSDCVLAPAKDALVPYAAALKAKGWNGEKSDTFWTPPAGAGTCLSISAFQTNFSMRERTVLEFRVSDCAKKEAS